MTIVGETDRVTPPRCSIVIRAYNEEEHIGRLLTGIMQQTIDDVQIILVDSGSTDATTSIAAHYPVITLHIQPEDFTFGRSLNLGLQNAKAEFVVIASAHVYPIYPDWLEKLLEPLNNSDIALVYGKQRGGENTKFSEHQVFAQWYPDQTRTNQTHPFCNNANAAIRRSVWEQHPYDETLTGLEDLAWARWAIDQGFKLAYNAEAEVVHVHNETPLGVYNRYRREAMAFKKIYPQEKFGLVHFLHLTGTNIASDLIQAAKEGALSSSLMSIFWFRIMQFWGTYQGYRNLGPITEELRRTFYYPARKNGQKTTSTRDIKPIQYHD